MKVEIEFELLKDEPKIVELIAGRVYALDCVDKPKDVKARVVDQELTESDPVAHESRDVSHNDHPARHWDRTCPACNASLEVAELVWPTLITLPVRHMPEEVKP